MNRPDPHLVDALEVPEVSGDEGQVVAQGGCRYLKVGVGEARSLVSEGSGKSAVHLGDGRVERQDRHGGQHPLFDHREVPATGWPFCPFWLPWWMCCMFASLAPSGQSVAHLPLDDARVAS